jgi:uncharacterized oxidoreductase
MKLTGNTLLITGGSSGIGLGLARAFLELGNTVIVTGRNSDKLADIKRALPQLHTFQSDVTDPGQMRTLHSAIVEQFPGLDVLVNNAGIMRKINLQDARREPLDTTREIDTNLTAPIQLVQIFLPQLRARPEAAIVNITSGLAFLPLPISPIYSASKAALHSYTQSLRIQLSGSAVKVFELAPPGTDTHLFFGDFDAEDLAGMKPMTVEDLVKKAMAGFASDRYEIRPGISNVLKVMSRLAPGFMLSQLGKSARRMHPVGVAQGSDL